MNAQDQINETQLMLIRRMARLFKAYRDEPAKRGKVLGNKRQALDMAIHEVLRAMGEDK